MTDQDNLGTIDGAYARLKGTRILLTVTPPGDRRNEFSTSMTLKGDPVDDRWLIAGLSEPLVAAIETGKPLSGFSHMEQLDLRLLKKDPKAETWPETPICRNCAFWGNAVMLIRLGDFAPERSVCDNLGFRNPDGSETHMETEATFGCNEWQAKVKLCLP